MAYNRTYKTVDAYIAAFPKDINSILSQVRDIIKKEAPNAIESISYQMPAYKLNGKPLVYYAAQSNFLGFYPTPSGINKFKENLKQYKSSKGAVQFPYNSDIPYDLIKDIVAFRVQEISQDAA